MTCKAEFLATEDCRVAEYDYAATEPEFLSIRHPEAKIDRIFILD